MNNMVNHIFKSIDMVGSMAVRNRASIMKLSRSNAIVSCATLLLLFTYVSVNHRVFVLEDKVKDFEEKISELNILHYGYCTNEDINDSKNNEKSE